MQKPVLNEKTHNHKREFLRKKVLIDFELTEKALKDIVGRLKQGQTVGMRRYARNTQIHQLREEGKTQQAIADEVGRTQGRVSQILEKPVRTPKTNNHKRTDNNTRNIYLSRDPATAARNIREKFGDAFWGQLKLESGK